MSCVCCVFVAASLVIQAKFSFYPGSTITQIDIFNTSLNFSNIRNGNDVTPVRELRNVTRSKFPVHHVNFLKVHKAGSTTMQNLMFRFGLRHNLTVLLPRSGNYLLGRNAMPLKKGGHYDIFACHTVFSKKVFGYMPDDTVNIGIIREPLERAISAAYYYRDVFNNPYLKRIPGDKFIENLVSSPEKYDSGVFSYTKNAMGKDFGFSAGLQNQKDKVNFHLAYLKKEFQVVMVMERFEESLVLLKRELGWSLEDILFIQSNSHQHKQPDLSPEQRSKFRQTCHLDYAIYDTFYPIFEAKVAAEGPDFKEEVDKYKSILLNVKELCNTTKIAVVSTLQVPVSKWNQPFQVTKRDCELMTKGEINFINEIRANQKS